MAHDSEGEAVEHVVVTGRCGVDQPPQQPHRRRWDAFVECPQALDELGLLEDAQQLDLRSPAQDYFNLERRRSVGSRLR